MHLINREGFFLVIISYFDSDFTDGSFGVNIPVRDNAVGHGQETDELAVENIAHVRRSCHRRLRSSGTC